MITNTHGALYFFQHDHSSVLADLSLVDLVRLLSLVCCFTVSPMCAKSAGILFLPYVLALPLGVRSVNPSDSLCPVSPDYFKSFSVSEHHF